MNGYFIKTDKNQFGPLTLEMLKCLSIHRDIMLWRKGVNEWQKADEFPELQSIFTDAPPSLDTTSVHRHSYITRKMLLFRLAKCVKPALIASVIVTTVIGFILWFTFKPNKFGEAEVERINRYFSEQQLKFQAQQMQMKIALLSFFISITVILIILYYKSGLIYKQAGILKS